MKKADRYITCRVHPVRMDLDDFDAIMDVLAESKCIVHRIVANGYELDTPDEIEKLSQSRILDLRIEAQRPYIVLYCDSGAAVIGSYSEDVLSAGIVKKIAGIVDRYPRFYRLFNFWLLGILSCLSLGAIAHLMLDDKVPPHQIIMWSGVALVIFGSPTLLYNRAFVLFKRRKQETFSRRHGDAIKYLIGSVTGGLILIIAGAVLHNIFPELFIK